MMLRNGALWPVPAAQAERQVSVQLARPPPERAGMGRMRRKQTALAGPIARANATSPKDDRTPSRSKAVPIQAGMPAILSRKADLAFSYRGKTAALTESEARSGWPESKGGWGSYSM